MRLNSFFIHKAIIHYNEKKNNQKEFLDIKNTIIEKISKRVRRIRQGNLLGSKTQRLRDEKYE